MPTTAGEDFPHRCGVMQISFQRMLVSPRIRNRAVRFMAATGVSKEFPDSDRSDVYREARSPPDLRRPRARCIDVIALSLLREGFQR